MILDALDTQDRQLDVQLWQAIRTKASFIPAGGTIVADSAFTQDIKDIVTQLINEIRTNPNDPCYQSLTTDITNLENAFQKQAAADIAAEMFDTGTELGQAIVAVLQSGSMIVTTGGASNNAAFMQKLKAQLAKIGPTLTAVLGSISVVVTIG